MRVQRLMLLCSLLIGFCVAAPLLADEIGQSGRAVAAKWKDTVVSVKIAAKITATYEGETSVDEQKTEVIGAVIDPSGLIAVSLKSADIVEAYTSMMGGEADGEQITGEITDMKVLLADGTEMPAKIVLRDKDLDLAFLLPVKALEQPLVALDLSESASLELLDQVILLSRMGAIANRTANVTLDRVHAVIEKPRTLYVTGLASYMSEVGASVFNAQGTLVGLLLTKVSKNEDGETDGIYCILPAGDIADAAKQAMEGEEK